MFSSHEDEEVDSEQPQWATELASAVPAGAASGPGKLPLPTPGGPQPFPVYDSSSSSSDDSDDEHAAPHAGAGRVVVGDKPTCRRHAASPGLNAGLQVVQSYAGQQPTFPLPVLAPPQP